jgi:hypothetical protein
MAEELLLGHKKTLIQNNFNTVNKLSLPTISQTGLLKGCLPPAKQQF